MIVVLVLLSVFCWYHRSTLNIAKKVSIQGELASFHDIAAKRFFGDTYQPTFCNSFSQTIQALNDGTVDHAVCAIENSLYGSINEVYDLILKNDSIISGEVYLRIEQCLIGLPGANLDGITAVYSHPVAIAQCEDFLDKHLPHADRLEYHDTAASVEMIQRLKDPSIAAIAGKDAAEQYGAAVLAHSIETNKENYTRFVVLSTPSDAVVANPNKTSLTIETGHTPGALHKALGVFADRSINLTKLQSRPIIGKAWHYIFYVDIDAGTNNPDCRAALEELTNQGCKVRVLGSYLSGLTSTSLS